MTSLDRLLWQAASVCLRYPVRDDLSLVRDILPSFVDLALTSENLECHYVETFDFTNRHSLYLTWHVDGDTRRRGGSLVTLKRAYAQSGLLLTDAELPDFLPAVLEYSARTGDSQFLSAYRPAMENLHRALQKAGTIYAVPVEAVIRSVPPGPPMEQQQPPLEMVGLR